MQLIRNKARLLSIDIDLGTYATFIERIISLAKINQSSYVCVANVHMLVEAHQEKGFAKVVNDADLVTPDGMPLAKGLQILSGIKQDRVAGMDLLPDLLKAASEEQIAVFFYGGTEAMLQETSQFCELNYPQLKLVGFHSPPFRSLTMDEQQDVVKKINDSGAGLILVALGCPKQEKWMASMKGKIDACMIGIGGAVPVMVGLQTRAPKWMQKASLEWLYRLFQEPKRLFKRYFLTNSLFIFLLTKAFLKRSFDKL